MSDFLEYSFRIIGPTPTTMPMSRLAVYMGELARLMGSQEAIHFERVESGSVAIVVSARQSEISLISPRLRAVSGGDTSADGAAAWRKINEYLAEDGWGGEMTLPRSGQVIVFPGKAKAATAIRSINQATTVQGRLVRIQGGGEVVRVGLDIDGDLTAGISIDAHNAHKLAQYFHQNVRLSGDGRWKRNSDGKWSLESLSASSFEVLEDDDLKQALQRLGQVIPAGTGKDILKAVDELRSA
ncbi:MAG: hypothetical protein H5U11_18340 [Rhizobium sp.]|nr:hypothetical protein [Rhizobium sp.]